MNADVEKQTELHELQSRLAILKELQACDGYRQILLPKLKEAEAIHLAGVTSRTGNRDVHLEAWHLANELKDFVSDSIKATEKRLVALCGDNVSDKTEVEN